MPPIEHYHVQASEQDEDGELLIEEELVMTPLKNLCA